MQVRLWQGWICLWAWLAWCRVVAGPAFSVQNWHADHGLPQNTVQALLQTRNGYVWVGTRFGLARFDGVRFHTVPMAAADSGVADSISALAEGPDGTLWVGTLRGLFQWTAGRLERVPEFPEERVWALWPEANQRLWLGLGRGVGLFEEGRLSVFDAPGDEDGGEDAVGMQVRSLAPLEPDALLVTTLDGALRFDRLRRSWSSWAFPSVASAPAGEATAAVPAVWETEPWSPGDAAHFAREAFESRNARPSRNSWGPRILPDGPGAWWVLDGRRRLHRMDAGGIVRWPPRSGGTLDEILCAMRDREGGVWLGTVANGVLRLRPPIFQTIALGTGDDAAVFSVTGRPDGTVWAASRSLLARMSGGGVEFLPLNFGDRARQVMSLLPDGNGLWLGRERGGLWRWDEGQTSHHSELFGLSPGARIRALYRSGDGSLWMGLRRGLMRLSSQGLEVIAPENRPDSPDVGALHEDPRGRIWAGTDGDGVRRLDPDGWKRIGPGNGLPMPTVWGFLQDRLGALWLLGTGGITRHLDDRFATVTREAGLYDDVNNQMFEDATGHFWIGCNRGIYRVATNELHAAAEGRGRVNSVVFGVADGLAVAETNGENQPAGWMDPQGVLWFPSPAGVVRVDPGVVAANEVPPVVAVETATIGPVSVWDDAGPNPELRRGPDGLAVPPGNARVLEIHYTANSFSAPERVRFRHRLVGHESDWVEAGTRRVAYYTNLRPGPYRFEVTACNNHGLWATVPALLAFRIEPDWYQTPAFFMGLGLAIAGMVWMVHRVRVGFLQRRLALEGQLELAQERERIARDMHDDIGAGLTQIGLLTQRAARAAPGETPQLLERIAGASRNATQAMDEIVWAVNPRNDRLEPLVDYLCQFAREYLEPTGVRCLLDVPALIPEVAVPSDVRHHLLLALKESLSNAVRHSGAAEVRIGLRMDGGRLHLRVEDNGSGMAPSEGIPSRPLGGNGLANLRRRMESLGGECRWTRVPGGGTRMEAVVPLVR